MLSQVHAQEWLDSSLYPFTTHQFETGQGRMSYVDTGRGETFLFVHGTPTWSFLYRRLIKSLSRDYRCVAPDHLGFGLSDKPKDFEGTPQAHARNLLALIEKLDLRDISLVVHDFGGPIGLAAAEMCPERVKRIVLFNTWLWATAENPQVQKIDKLVRSGLGRFLYLHLNISPRLLLKQGFEDKANLSKDVHRHYYRLFPDKESRKGLLQLARSLAGSSDWYQKAWENLEALEDKPWLIMWGMKDSFIDSTFLRRWQERLPKAQTHELDCGHFVMEEKPELVVEKLRAWIGFKQISLERDP